MGPTERRDSNWRRSPVADERIDADTNPEVPYTSKEKALITFSPMKTILHRFEEQKSSVVAVAAFSFRRKQYVDAKISLHAQKLTRGYEMLPQTVKKWKVQLEVLQKCQLL